MCQLILTKSLPEPSNYLEEKINSDESSDSVEKRKIAWYNNRENGVQTPWGKRFSHEGYIVKVQRAVAQLEMGCTSG